MPEQWFRQTEYKVDYVCNECKKGKVFHVKKMATKFVGKNYYHHVCQECGHNHYLDKIYPQHIHKPMTKFDKKETGK